MDYAKPTDVIASMIDAGQKKLALSPRDLMIRGALSGALLGAATTLAFTGAVTTNQPPGRRADLSRRPRDDRAARA